MLLPVAKAFFAPKDNVSKGLAPAFVGLSRHREVRHALLDIAAIIRDLASQQVNATASQLHWVLW
jgi:hypothetical protein